MPPLGVSPTRMARRASRIVSRSLQARQNNVDSTSQTLIIVGIVCGAVAAIVLVGILIYLVIQQRRRDQTHSSSRIRVGYTQTRTVCTDTYGSTYKETLDQSRSGYKYDPESSLGLPGRKTGGLRLDTALAPPRHTSLMQSATSPPPQHARHWLGQPIRPHAELRVGDTPVDRSVSYVPPAPPSWASIWPTESGWTGPGGDPSIRDEDFGESSDESSSEDGKRPDAKSSEPNRHDAEPSEHTFGPFKLSPTLFRGSRRNGPEINDQPTTPTIASPISHPLSVCSLSLDDDVHKTPLAEDTYALERSTTRSFTLAFGTARLGAASASRLAGHTRTPSSVPLTRSTTRVTRSSTVRTAHSEASTVSGQILSAFTGRLATPLLKSVESLRREYLSADPVPSAAPGNIRRLPALPDSVPPVPPLIPAQPALPHSSGSPISPPPVPHSISPARHHATAPAEIPIRPLPVPTPPSLSGRTPSLGADDSRATPNSIPNPASPLRSVSENASAAVIRPLPIPPVVRP